MNTKQKNGDPDKRHEEVRLPEGIGNAFAFQACNTLSYSVVLGTPMVLWFQNAGATATLLGLVVALMPLFTVLQIPAARYVEIMGFRKLVLNGWATRSFFIVGMAVVAFLPESFDLVLRMGLMFLFLAAFNAVRGIATAGLMPWMTQLVPGQVRGRFVSRDQLAQSFALFASMLLVVSFFNWFRSRYNFSILFLWSYLMALLSLFFLRKIPDVAIPEEDHSKGHVPWREIATYRPFTRLLAFSIFMAIGFAASAAFWVKLLKEKYGAGNEVIFIMMAIWSVSLAITLMLLGPLSDRVGSKPLIALSLFFYTFHFAGWAGLGAGILPFNWWVLTSLQASAGVSAAIYNTANARLVMATMPVQGRAHFFALHTVTVSLVMGLLPTIYGLAIDAMESWKVAWGRWEWNAYSLLYSLVIFVTIAGQWFRHRIPEPHAMDSEAFFREFFLKTPARALARLFPQRPPV